MGAITPLSPSPFAPSPQKTRCKRRERGAKHFFPQLIVLLLFISLFTTGITPAQAHANLVRSEPGANAVLDGSPSQVRLWFSETPEPGFTKIQLLDKNGKEITGVGSLSVDPGNNQLLSVSLPTLSPGIYTVVWRATSAVDGHSTAGGFAFAVGRDQVPVGGLNPGISGAATSTSGPTVPSVAVRWLSYLSMALLTGGFAFVPLVFQPALNILSRRKRSAEPAPASSSGSFSHASGLFGVLVASWLILLIATIAGAVVETGSASGGNFSFASLIVLLTATRYGTLFWLRIGLLILIGGLLILRQSRWWRREWAMRWWQIGLVFNIVVLLGTSLSSHAAAMTDPTVPVIADWLHMLVASLWLGGLTALLLSLLWLLRTEGDKSGSTAAVLIVRYSQMASVCLITIILTGVIQAFFEVADIANFIDTQYGQVLLLKLGLLLPLSAVGAFNFLLVNRRIKKELDAAEQNESARPWQVIVRRTVASEIGLIAAILLVTGILTTLPPSREAFGTGIVARGQQDDLRIVVAANPGLPGLNVFDIYIKDMLNRPVTGIEKVALLISMQAHNMGQSEADAVSVGYGHYVAQGAYLSMVGTWQTIVLVRRPGQFDTRLPLTMSVISTTQQLPTSPVLIAPSRLFLGLEIIVGGALLFIGARRLGRARRWAGWLGFGLGTIGVILGLAVGAGGFATGVSAIPALQNPIPADAASLTRGQGIYQANCESCHGTSGAGDGPLGKNLNPPPANFQIHMAAGHTDGELFNWVTQGIEGSAMPSYGATLTENQRWDVINYIRTFAGVSK
jgi:copper transport protein